MKMWPRRYLFLFLPVFVVFTAFNPVWAADVKGESSSQSGQNDAMAQIKQLEKRITELEALVKSLMAGKGSGIVNSVSQPSSTEKNLAGKKSVAPTKAAIETDEWSEPSTETKTSSRDEEARRRLTDLETWKLKEEAKEAKAAEEAADKVKLAFSGEYKLRLNSTSNLNLNNSLQFWQFDNSAWFDQMIQLRLEAEYGPLYAMLVLDKGNTTFDWKEGTQGTLERWGQFTTVSSSLVREFYVLYTGSVVVKGGRQNIDLGNGGIVLSGPQDALKVSYPFGRTPIGDVLATGAYIAVAGGYNNYNGITYPPGVGDRSNALFGFSNKLDAYLVSFDIKPSREITIEPYALKVIDRGKFGDPDLNLDRDYNAATTPRDGGFDPLWTGVALSGRAGRLSYTGDFVYLTGTQTKKRNYNAYALMVRGDYNLSGLVPLRTSSVGLEFGRGSGNTAEERASGTGDVKDFTGLFLCKDRRTFGDIFSRYIRAGFFLADSDLANVTFLRAIASFEPVKKLQATLSLLKLWTTESVFKGRGPVLDWSVGTSTTTEKTNDIGWELDLNLAFPIYKRLTGFTETGYFIPGDVYRQADGSSAKPASEFVLGTEYDF